MDCSIPGFPVLHHLLEFAQTHVMPSNCLILCCPLFLLPTVFPSLRAFSSESALCIRWPKYWSFTLIINPSNGCSGVISFRVDWFDILAVQQTLKSLLQFQQFKSINSLVPSLLYGPTVTSVHDCWKNHSFNYLDLCQQVMSLLFNMLSWFVIAFLPRSKRLLISWLRSPICSDFRAQENKVCHCFHCFPIYLP